MTRVRLLITSTLLVVIAGFLGTFLTTRSSSSFAAGKGTSRQPDRSPVDLVLSADEQWAVTANETSASISLVDLASGRVATELSCGAHPAAVAAQGETLLVTCSYS